MSNTPAIPATSSDTHVTASMTTVTTTTKSGAGGDSEGKYVVIGMAQDTDPKNLVTFCASLRE